MIKSLIINAIILIFSYNKVKYYKLNNNKYLFNKNYQFYIYIIS